LDARTEAATTAAVVGLGVGFVVLDRTGSLGLLTCSFGRGSGRVFASGEGEDDDDPVDIASSCRSIVTVRSRAVTSE
jgi:hypothetical protein